MKLTLLITISPSRAGNCFPKSTVESVLSPFINVLVLSLMWAGFFLTLGRVSPLEILVEHSRFNVWSWKSTEQPLMEQDGTRKTTFSKKPSLKHFLWGGGCSSKQCGQHLDKFVLHYVKVNIHSQAPFPIKHIILLSFLHTHPLP